MLHGNPEPGPKSPSSRPMHAGAADAGARARGRQQSTRRTERRCAPPGRWRSIRRPAGGRCGLPRILGPVLQLTGPGHLPLPVAPELQDGAQRRRVPVAPGLRQLGRGRRAGRRPSPDAQRADHARRHDGGKRAAAIPPRAPMSKDCCARNTIRRTTSYALHCTPDADVERLLAGGAPFQCKPGPAGTVVLFGGNLVHGSQRNRSDRRPAQPLLRLQHLRQPAGPGLSSAQARERLHHEPGHGPLAPVSDDALIDLANARASDKRAARRVTAGSRGQTPADP